MGEPKVINNLELHPDEKFVVVSINPKIYPLDIVYSAAHIFLERSFVVVDGDPENEIIVELKPKKEGNIEELGRDFNNELIVHAAARLGHPDDSCKVELTGKVEVTKEMSYLDDPLGIARPWEEVYGKGGDK